MGKYLDETGLSLVWQTIKNMLTGGLSNKKDKAALIEQAGETQSHILADNTEYKLLGVGSLTLAYPDGNFECWLSVVIRGSAAATVSFPAGTAYIGEVPSSFEAGKTYEISIKNGTAIIGKVLSE